MKSIRTLPAWIPFGWQSALAGLILLIAADSELSAQPMPVKAKQETSVITRDGWQLPVTYYKAGEKEAPVVVLLHGENSNKLVYEVPKGLAELLHEKGFAVITVDFRKFGKSKHTGGLANDKVNANDYTAMVLGDLDAIKKFIYDEHQAGNLNMRKTGIVAADMSTPVAVNFALSDWLKKPYQDAPTLAASTPRGQDVRAMVLISPQTSVPRLPSGQALAQLRNPAWNISFLLAVGDSDNLDRGQSKKLHTILTGGATPEEADQNIFYREYPTKARGTALLLDRNLRLMQDILVFFDLKLMKLPDQWQDRKPRL